MYVLCEKITTVSLEKREGGHAYTHMCYVLCYIHICVCIMWKKNDSQLGKERGHESSYSDSYALCAAMCVCVFFRVLVYINEQAHTHMRMHYVLLCEFTYFLCDCTYTWAHAYITHSIDVYMIYSNTSILIIIDGHETAFNGF